LNGLHDFLFHLALDRPAYDMGDPRSRDVDVVRV
jgi:hypothetical protein